MTELSHCHGYVWGIVEAIEREANADFTLAEVRDCDCKREVTLVTDDPRVQSMLETALARGECPVEICYDVGGLRHIRSIRLDAHGRRHGRHSTSESEAPSKKSD